MSAPTKIPSCRWPGRDQSPLPNTKANQNQRTQQISKPNILIQRTKNKGVYQKKKKNPQYTNPVTHGVHRRRRRRSEVLVVVFATKGLIASTS